MSEGLELKGRVPVVGVGASSGGLEAFAQLLRPMPVDSGFAFVLIQHLERTHPSALAEIIGRATQMPVTEAKDGLLVERNRIYVIPPGSDIKLSAGKLILEEREGKSSTHLPVDRFFRSLARDLGSLAVGIILSGSGSDGTQGLLSIKEACGITFAQEETSAEFQSMPHSAIASGSVDFVMHPGEMAAELVNFGKQIRGAVPHVPAETPPWSAQDETELSKILGMLHKRTRIDFTHYKRKTVNRRIARRMMVQKLKTLSEYAHLLEGDPAEVSNLFREILINVTSFFREPASFEQLTKHWKEKLQDRTPGQPVRAWVAACATGEEVYSVAICLMELFGGSEYKCPIQIFGTDINDAALEIARTGIYPESIASEVSAERLHAFFSKTDRGYQVSKEIRECCIFARHDLTKDPPFSKLDLVSCRNVLIYMGPVLQKRIVPMFHYSLKPGGFLMLGSAEALSGNGDLFKILDKQNKLFQRQQQTSRFTPEFETRRDPEQALAQGQPLDGNELEEMAQRTIRDRFASDGVVINRDMRIVLFRGHTSPYIDPAPGNPSLNLLRMVRDDLSFKLESMVSRAIQQNTAVRETGVRTSEEGLPRAVSLEVIPLQTTSGSDAYYLITFESEPPTDSAEQNGTAAHTASEHVLVQELERELAEARAHLRNMAEEHEVHLEELRAANEEVRSTNEELQSSNEELGTTKEELQSTNEELSTVNQELSTKNTYLAALNDDLKNLFTAASLPIVMVDGNLRLRRFTQAAEKFLNLVASDIGRVVTDLRLSISVPQFREMLEKATHELSVSNVTVLAENERWYTVTIRPYRTAENRIDGAVIAFTDIDTLKRSLSEAQDAREYAESILETLWEPLIILDADMRVQRATTGFYRTFQMNREETEGRLFFKLGSGQWDLPKLRVLLDDILPRNTSFEDFPVESTFPKLGFRSMRLNARRIRRKVDGGAAILIAIDDVTERREAAEIRFLRLFQTAKDGILELDGNTGEILDVNPFFLQLSNCGKSDLVGKKPWETGLFEGNGHLRDLTAETKQREVLRFDSLLVRARDGKRFETEMVCNRYMVGNEPVIQCNIRDVTDRRRAEDELRRSNEDLQQFAYAASHDLQEPLRMVGAYTQLLDKKFHPLVDEEGAKYLDVITSSVRRMEQLIKDLLVYSQTSVHEARATPVSAEKVLGLTVMNLQLAISDTDTIITNDALPVVNIDQIYFVQVFQNLIANAIKYRTPGVSPRIHISAERRSSEWLFSVADNGLGFDDQYAEQIFGVFKRLHGKDYPGTGIGLSICKKIIEREGGRIWAKSKVGQGSTFFFTVPDRSSQR